MDGRQRRTRGPRLSTADCLERETARDIRVSWPWRKHALRGPRYGVSKLLAGSNRGLSPGFANARNHHGFGRGNDRDLKFIDAILATLREKYSIDENRVYATGFSNGGLFTYLLLSQRSNVFAAFAPGGAVLLP